MRKICLYLSENSEEKLVTLARKNGITNTAMINEMITQYDENTVIKNEPFTAKKNPEV